MKVFAIGDLHLSFGEGIEKPMDVFGPAWEDYENRLSENWYADVGADDLVIIPGDISWAMHLEDALADLAWISALPGKKVLVRGNHDLWWCSLKKMQAAAPSLYFLQNDAYLDEENGFAVVGSRGWLCPGDRNFTEADRKIYDRELLRLGMSLDAAARRSSELGKPLDIIGAMHFAPTNEKKQPSGFTELFSNAGAKTVVYGHLHGSAAYGNGPAGFIDNTEYILCSLDKLECRPKLIYESRRV